MARYLKFWTCALLIAPLLLSNAQRLPLSKNKSIQPQAAGLEPVVQLPPPPVGNHTIPENAADASESFGGLSSSSSAPSTDSQATSPTTTVPTLSSSVSSATIETTVSASTNTTVTKRSVNPLCLRTVELSCLNIAANCLDSVNGGNSNNIWSIRSCTAAATCYGVGNLISSITCQTGFALTNADEADLDYNVYATIVGSCAYAPGGCAITQQNFIDWYYGTLTLINTANWPSSANVIIAFFNAVRTSSGAGATVWYSNFNNYLHFSSSPPPPPTTTSAGHQYTPVTWNPNPAPSSGAASQTFVKAGTTVIIAVPTVTTTVVVVGTTITLAPGGTPIVAVMPPDITQPNAVSPTFNYNPVIPATASSVTFKSGTWTSIVAVPTSSTKQVTVIGPPDDGNDNDDDDSWILALGLLGPLLLGTVPSSVSVVPGLVPVPVPPSSWPDDGPWPPPVPPPGGSDDPDDDDEDDDDDDESTCTATLPAYFEPYDPSGEEPENDESYLKRRYNIDPAFFNQTGNASFPHIFQRAGRNIRLGECGPLFTASSKGFTVGTYFSYKNPAVIPAVVSASTTLYTVQNSRHISHDGKIKEHIFELRYISDFVRNQFPSAADCGWLTQNMWSNTLNGVAVSRLLYDAIDHTSNFVWADEAINKAKSSVVNNNSPTPMASGIALITSLNDAVAGPQVRQVESQIRAFGVLGAYFTQNADRYSGGAQRVQDILALITPTTPIFPPLDTRWNNFVRTTVQGYPNSITTRGVNALNRYRETVDNLLRNALAQVPLPQPPPSVPACWRVYHDATIGARLAAGGINWQNFVVPALPHAPCNTAGTSGMVIFFYDPVTGAPGGFVGNPVAQLYALGTSYYGIGLPSLSAILYDIDLNVWYPGGLCAGIHYAVPLVQGTVNYPVAQFDQDCRGSSGKALSDLYLRSNGQRLSCFFNVFNDGSDGEALDCGPTQAAVQTCITHMNSLDNRPNGFLYVPTFRFAAQ